MKSLTWLLGAVCTWRVLTDCLELCYTWTVLINCLVLCCTCRVLTGVWSFCWNLTKIFWVSYFVEFVLGRFSHFNIAIAYSNSKFCGASTSRFCEFTCNLSKTSTPLIVWSCVYLKSINWLSAIILYLKSLTWLPGAVLYTESVNWTVWSCFVPEEC